MSLCYCAMGDGWMDGMGRMSASEQDSYEVGMHQKEKNGLSSGARGEQRD